MNEKTPVLGLTVAFLASLAGFSAASYAADASDADSATGSGWKISAGVGYRTVRGVTFQTGMRSAPYSDSVSGAGAQVGSATECANRQYDDGYINMRNPSFDGTSTRDWDHDGISYYDSWHLSGEQIVFHAVTEYRTVWNELSAMPEGWKNTDHETVNYTLSASRTLLNRKNWNVGVESDLLYLTLSGNKTMSSVYQRAVYQKMIVDTYITEGSVDFSTSPLIPVPHNGAYLNGTPSIREEVVTKVCEDVWTKTVSESLESEVLTFSLGLGVEYAVSRLALSAGVGSSLTFVHSEAERCETDGYRQQTWLDSSSADEWAAGCYGKVGVTLKMTERLQTGILGRYDWIEKISGAVGPSTYEIDLDGFSLVAAASVAF